MQTHTRYVLSLVTALTMFSLYTIVSTRPRPNNLLNEVESTVPYDETDELKFLEQGDNLSQEFAKTNESSMGESISISNQENTNEIVYPPAKLDKFNFQVCDMSRCFDFSRCDPSKILSVHIVEKHQDKENKSFNISGESNIIHENIVKIVKRSIYYEPDMEKACILILDDDTLDRDPLSTSFRHYSDDLLQRKHEFGMNHLVLNLYSGSWPDYRENDFSGYNIGAAILAKASNSALYHRKNFDISIPLISFTHPVYSDVIDGDVVYDELIEKNKTYLLTFKGKRYVIGSGSDTRNSLYHLNNQRDVIMLTTCKHGKKWREVNDVRCQEDEIDYAKHDFVDLMRGSTFCLTPRGRRLGSFRFLEALRYGCIPVVLSDGWVWPFGEIIDWSQSAIQYDEDQVLLVPDMLRDIDPERVSKMRENCAKLYQKYFSSLEKIVNTVLSIIERRVKHNHRHWYKSTL